MTAPRMTLAIDSTGKLDDVVVSEVSAFRAEMMSKGHLWLACYLPNTGVDGDRITFEVIAKGSRLEFTVGEMPGGAVEGRDRTEGD